MILIYILLGIILLLLIHISHDISRVKKMILLLAKGLSDDSENDD